MRMARCLRHLLKCVSKAPDIYVIMIQDSRNGGGAEAIAPSPPASDFGRSGNPIPIQGTDYACFITTPPPPPVFLVLPRALNTMASGMTELSASGYLCVTNFSEKLSLLNFLPKLSRHTFLRIETKIDCYISNSSDSFTNYVQ